MTAADTTLPSESAPNSGGSAPAGWAELRSDGDVQFAPVPIPDIPPPAPPSWFQQMLDKLLAWLADLFGPVGEALAASWWWLQWVLLAAVAVFALVLLMRMFGPGVGRGAKRAVAAEAEWLPDTAATLALLEEADRLAAEGSFDAATRLLLQRSVGHIAASRPDWVEPSSTARELAALPALPDTARAAFRVIAERVERSLFALRALDRADWDAARAAYAEFARARLNSQGHAT